MVYYRQYSTYGDNALPVPEIPKLPDWQSHNLPRNFVLWFLLLMYFHVLFIYVHKGRKEKRLSKTHWPDYTANVSQDKDTLNCWSKLLDFRGQSFFSDSNLSNFSCMDGMTLWRRQKVIFWLVVSIPGCLRWGTSIFLSAKLGSLKIR